MPEGSARWWRAFEKDELGKLQKSLPVLIGIGMSAPAEDEAVVMPAAMQLKYRHRGLACSPGADRVGEKVVG